ncbi:MAG TPA: hypothetical protein VFR37_16055 [Longimicrobium sp.]|nr:hypothetical protein [Longimicrobium sp.]
MYKPKLKLAVEELNVDSFHPEFDTGTGGGLQSIYVPTVLGYTEAYSCEGTCGTCGGTDCYA